MGSSRKKGASHQRRPSSSPPSNLHKETEASQPSSWPQQGLDSDKKSVDFSLTLQEAQVSAFHVSWKEILWIVVATLTLALLSICIGVAAGLSISIHYYESLDAPTLPPLLMEKSRERGGFAPHQHVTRLDPLIAATSLLPSPGSGKMAGTGLDLGRIVTMSATGQRSVLMVVEETTPIGQERVRLESSSPRLIPPPKMEWSQVSRVQPSLCSDGRTIGYDRWSTLKAAVQEANLISAERYLRWTEYFAISDATFTGTFDDASLYYQEDIVLTICPGVTLRARKGPIFINAENIRIECEGCVVDVGGTHLAFGPHARNILVRGITFKHAHRSSLVFYYDGAEATFEDCLWKENGPDNRKFGAVADVNSTCILNFYRCQIGNEKAGFLSRLTSFLSL